MRAMLFAALLLSGAAFAQCEKVEYVELKDWSVEDIEKRYCYDEKLSHIEMDTALKIGALRLEMQQKLGHDSASFARDQESRLENSSVCADEVSKMARLLKNVYHKDRPTCASANTGGPRRAHPRHGYLDQPQRTLPSSSTSRRNIPTARNSLRRQTVAYRLWLRWCFRLQARRRLLSRARAASSVLCAATLGTAKRSNKGQGSSRLASATQSAFGKRLDSDDPPHVPSVSLRWVYTQSPIDFLWRGLQGAPAKMGPPSFSVLRPLAVLSRKTSASKFRYCHC